MKAAKVFTKAGFILHEEGEYMRYVIVKEVRATMGTAPVEEGRFMVDLAWGRAHRRNAVIKDIWEERELTGYGGSIVLLRNDDHCLGVSAGGYLVAAGQGVCTIGELKAYIREVLRISGEVNWT